MNMIKLSGSTAGMAARNDLFNLYFTENYRKL